MVVTKLLVHRIFLYAINLKQLLTSFKLPICGALFLLLICWCIYALHCATICTDGDWCSLPRLLRLLTAAFLGYSFIWVSRRFIYHKSSWKYERTFYNLFSIPHNTLSLGVGILSAIAYYYIDLSTPIYVDTNEKEPNSSNAIFLSASMATLGWMVIAKLNSLIQRRKHTIDILLLLRSKENRKLLKDISDEYPVESYILHKDTEKIKENKKLKWKIMSFLNLMETIAISAKLKELDRQLLEMSIKPQFVGVYIQMLLFIKEIQKGNENIPEEDQTYNHLKWLVEDEWCEAFLRQYKKRIKETKEVKNNSILLNKHQKRCRNIKCIYFKIYRKIKQFLFRNRS